MTARKSTTSQVQKIEVARSGVGQRLDNYLLKMWKGVPRSHVYRLIREGQVRVNGSRSRVHRKLADGDLIRLPPIRAVGKESITPRQEFRILLERTLYEDNNLIVIDKPSGIASHGGSGIRGGVIEALRYYGNPNAYLELVHRLDRETSGCLMLAKDPETLRCLHSSLRDSSSNGIRKRYLSLLLGRWSNGVRDVDLSLDIVRSAGEGRRSVISTKGRSANSRFFPIQQLDEHVLVKIELETGRMHQIRAHAAAIGYPVAGDRRYGSSSGNIRLRRLGLKRLFLHAAEVELKHPHTGQRLRVTSSMPDELTYVLMGLA